MLELARPRILTGALIYLTRSRGDLVVENALLQHQVIVLERGAKRFDPQIIALIRTMASENRLWGAERIRGELAKLGIKVSKRTIQRGIEVVETAVKTPNMNTH